MDALEIFKTLFSLVMRFSSYLPSNEEISDMKTTELYAFLYVALFGPKKMKEIAEFLSTTKSNVTNVVDSLEKRGLVVREMDPVDRRTYRVVLTEKGKEIFGEILSNFESLLKSVLEKFSEEDFKVVSEGFNRMVEALSREGR
ncbi:MULTISPECIES: MarR family winged helix-turn-helix transcriptional regulator [Thermotoga]|uniref:Transcriptional regulator, putative, Mar family n=3 Tax=Thermotoga TaxID=2335 RepID=Q9WZS3_THEMA|nr:MULTISPECIES: MarR family transcriptional regulator [Thermotoga]KUK22107.1 MAG: Transcriptional regulator, MarR family [Thermotoga petrophila]AAD35898.1 transcriptional regulator, putative, Mar family [Thermotoga maritima MSB8]ACB08472.1 transcriptional regulator, MarR family [Thermotoga sp. RQ2]ADA66219.1 transcriptional regulator, MarR family [Thermotoga petrophila RKU-10]AGL49742.1 Transcriptional regulator, MarR family [Thermotoga maritima MSB8]